MKKLITILTIFGISFFFAITLASAGLFGFDDLIDKANQHIAKNELANANQLLHKAKLQNRNDPEIMYKAGLAYLSIGDKENSDYCFDRVRSSNSAKHKNYVAQHYYDLGQSAFNKKRFGSAEKHFKKYLTFAPQEAKQAVDRIYNIGIGEWNAGHRKTAYRAFKVAHNLDIASENTALIGDKISDLYFNTCLRSKKPCLNFLERSHEFSNKHTQESIDMIVKMANADNVPEKHRTELRNFLAKFNVPENERKKLIVPPPPDYENLKKGQYKVVYCPNGKPPKRYFRLPAKGHPFVVDLNEENTHFILKTRGGKIITSADLIKNDHVRMLERDFKIIPTIKKPLNIGLNVS